MIPAPPLDDADLPRFVAELGLPGLVDVHVHFLPDRVMDKVWAYFDQAETHYGTAWPVHYRTTARSAWPRWTSSACARSPRWSTRTSPAWAVAHRVGHGLRRGHARRRPDRHAVPRSRRRRYLGAAVEAGARAVKVHVQVGGFDPRDPVLQPAWGLLAEAGVPAIVHCGNGPIPGAHTGLDVFGEVLAAHPRLPVVLAHAGMPDFTGALDLVHRYERVHLDTTMVGTPFSLRMAPLPADWPARLVDVAERVVLGTDFPNIPYAYAEQVTAIAGWAAADDRLGPSFLRSVLHDAPARLLGEPG